MHVIPNNDAVNNKGFHTAPQPWSAPGFSRELHHWGNTGRAHDGAAVLFYLWSTCCCAPVIKLFHCYLDYVHPKKEKKKKKKSTIFAMVSCYCICKLQHTKCYRLQWWIHPFKFSHLIQNNLWATPSPPRPFLTLGTNTASWIAL